MKSTIKPIGQHHFLYKQFMCNLLVHGASSVLGTWHFLFTLFIETNAPVKCLRIFHRGYVAEFQVLRYSLWSKVNSGGGLRPVTQFSNERETFLSAFLLIYWVCTLMLRQKIKLDGFQFVTYMYYEYHAITLFRHESVDFIGGQGSWNRMLMPKFYYQTLDYVVALYRLKAINVEQNSN